MSSCWIRQAIILRGRTILMEPVPAGLKAYKNPLPIAQNQSFTVIAEGAFVSRIGHDKWHCRFPTTFKLTSSEDREPPDGSLLTDTPTTCVRGTIQVINVSQTPSCLKGLAGPTDLPLPLTAWPWGATFPSKGVSCRAAVRALAFLHLCAANGERVLPLLSLASSRTSSSLSRPSRLSMLVSLDAGLSGGSSMRPLIFRFLSSSRTSRTK